MQPPKPPNQPNLPQELTDLIIDNLKNSLHSLKSCSLVSRSWSTRSRFWLFRTLAITLAVTPSLRPSLRPSLIAPRSLSRETTTTTTMGYYCADSESTELGLGLRLREIRQVTGAQVALPDFSGIVRDLSVYGAGLVFHHEIWFGGNGTGSVLGKFKNLRRLTIRGFRLPHVMRVSDDYAYAREGGPGGNGGCLMPHLETLCLDRITFNSIVDLINLLHHPFLSNIQYLYLDSCSALREYVPTAQTLSREVGVRGSLKGLRLGRFGVKLFSELLRLELHPLYPIPIPIPYDLSQSLSELEILYPAARDTLQMKYMLDELGVLAGGRITHLHLIKFRSDTPIPTSILSSLTHLSLTYDDINLRSPQQTFVTQILSQLTFKFPGPHAAVPNGPNPNPNLRSLSLSFSGLITNPPIPKTTWKRILTFLTTTTLIPLIRGVDSVERIKYGMYIHAHGLEGEFVTRCFWVEPAKEMRGVVVECEELGQ